MIPREKDFGERARASEKLHPQDSLSQVRKHKEPEDGTELYASEWNERNCQGDEDGDEVGS